MSLNPSFAVVLDGGLVQYIIVQDWPRHLPLPAFAVVDYDTEGVAADEITHVRVGSSELEAVCRSELPEVFDSDSRALSPRGRACRAERARLRCDARAAGAGSCRAPDHPQSGCPARCSRADHYNELHVLANRGLINVLKALGDPSDFGD